MSVFWRELWLPTNAGNSNRGYNSRFSDNHRTTSLIQGVCCSPMSCGIAPILLRYPTWTRDITPQVRMLGVSHPIPSYWDTGPRLSLQSTQMCWNVRQGLQPWDARHHLDFRSTPCCQEHGLLYIASHFYGKFGIFLSWFGAWHWHLGFKGEPQLNSYMALVLARVRRGSAPIAIHWLNVCLFLLRHLMRTIACLITPPK